MADMGSDDGPGSVFLPGQGGIVGPSCGNAAGSDWAMRARGLDRARKQSAAGATVRVDPCLACEMSRPLPPVVPAVHWWYGAAGQVHTQRRLPFRLACGGRKGRQWWWVGETVQNTEQLEDDDPSKTSRNDMCL